MNYSAIKSTLDEISTRIVQNRKRLQQALAQCSTAEGDLNAMNTAYSSFVSDIEAEATANPGDQAIQLAKLEKDKMVAEFQNLKNIATNMKTDLQTYTP